MTIPNRISIALAASFLLLAPMMGLSLVEIGFSLVAAAIVFLLCFALFAAGAMGGGDAKLLTAASLWFGLTSSLVSFLVAVSYAGALVTLLFLLLRWRGASMLAFGIPLPQSVLGSRKIPYGIAIAIGGLIAFPASPLADMAMKPARIIILAVAVVAAGLAGMLAMRLSGHKAPQLVETVVKREPTAKVLVSADNLPVGSRLGEKSLQWAEWPKGGIAEGFITSEARPDAIKELNGSVVRLPMFKGEPVRAEKVADSSSRIMSSLLPSGKRAVATEISVATGAGGFVLPNDRVDVIMVRDNKDNGGGYVTENVLNNVRVLAIDQHIQEAPDGSKSVVGTTATLELTPDQAKVIAVAQQMAERLTLALRSVADAKEADTEAADYLLHGGGKADIQVIKSGSIITGSTQQTK
eukprot:g25359.t1